MGKAIYLKSCPFCGDGAHFTWVSDEGGGEHLALVAECAGCGARTARVWWVKDLPQCHDLKEPVVEDQHHMEVCAITLWNRREVHNA